MKCTTQQKEDGNENIFYFFSISWNFKCNEVTICQFKNGLGYANSKIICDNDKSYTTIQEMYADAWRYKGTFVLKDETYVVMEKENSK